MPRRGDFLDLVWNKENEVKVVVNDLSQRLLFRFALYLKLAISLSASGRLQIDSFLTRSY